MMYEVPLSRIDELADVSAEAFGGCDDLLGDFVFQNEPHHFLLKKRLFRSLVTSCSPRAIRQAISPNLEAVSIWFPPGMAPLEDAHLTPFGGQDFADLETIERMQAVNDVVGALTEHLGQEPQWYLHLVAVRPQFRGRKYSSLLIRPMLDQARKEDVPSTLITKFPENVGKYEKWGFKVVEEMAVPHSPGKFFSMRRD
jgi:GNAT superfamily N-acetyltransferase